MQEVECKRDWTLYFPNLFPDVATKKENPRLAFYEMFPFINSVIKTNLFMFLEDKKNENKENKEEGKKARKKM